MTGETLLVHSGRLVWRMDPMSKDSDFQTIRLDRDERGVATITMDRPADGNPMDEESIRELTLVAERLGEDDNVRVVVLTGEGDVFCAGGKPAFLEKLRNFSFAKNLNLGGQLDRMYATLSGLPKPLIGRINGDAIGGGTGLTTTCDIAIAVEEARFGFSDVRVGIAPTVVAPYFVRKVGPSFARAAFISCEKFDARRASEIGLVHRVVPKGDLDSAMDEMIRSCLMGAPRALAVAKRLPDIVQGGSEALRMELVEIVARLRETDEGREGLAALMEGRKPSWVPGVNNDS